MPEAHVVRFKIIKVECSAMPSGQHYTITYCRGDTNRSTPCYAADGGVVDFSSMPEGAAIVHFKTGKMRFLPKWITFRVEEFTRGNPRKTVGETQLDCAEVLGMWDSSASATRTLSFSMYGTVAHMAVAILVYPEGHPALSFGSLVPSQPKGNRSSLSKGADVKSMSRSEAMRLLISLEALLERRRLEVVAKKNGGSSLERRLAQLEERRRALSSVEGMATAVVKKRTEDVVVAQFVALSRRYRANFVGEVAAYLRQLAVASGVSLTSDISEESVPNIVAARERLQRINARIESLTQQMQKLEEVQKALTERVTTNGSSANVATELTATLTKVEALRSQINLLTKSRISLEDVVNGKGSNNTQIACEVREIRGRIQALVVEKNQLSENVRRMTVIAANHVLKWARSKNAPLDHASTDISTLFDVSTTQDGKNENVAGTELRSRILSTVSDMAKAISAKVNTDLLGKEKKLQKPTEKEQPGAKETRSAERLSDAATGLRDGASQPGPADAKLWGKHENPFISDLGSHMFGSPASKGSKNGNAPSSLPVLNFGSSSEDDEGAEATSAKTDENNMFAHGAMKDRFRSGGLETVADLVSIENDPMYDVVLTNKDTKKSLIIEIDDSSFFKTFAGDADSKQSDVEQFSAYNFDSNSATKRTQEKNERKLPMYDFGS